MSILLITCLCMHMQTQVIVHEVIGGDSLWKLLSMDASVFVICPVLFVAGVAA